MKSLNKKIKLLRKAEGMSQRQFGKEVGISQSVIGNFESGKQKSLGSEYLMNITNHPKFKKYTMWLLTENPPQLLEAAQVRETGAEYVTDSSEVRQENANVDIPDDVRQMILTMVDMAAFEKYDKRLSELKGEIVVLTNKTKPKT